MPKLNVKKGDRVKVIAGDDRGVIGEVIAVYPETGRVKVQGVNIVRKHVADRYDPRTGQQTKGGMVSVEAAIQASNVQLVVKKGGKDVVTRLGSTRKKVTKQLADGTKVATTRGQRVAVKTGEEIL
ncbi:MAG: 50S ribosomal protein L24 [Propionibacteriaceae bacterium]|jgi:large subunit ribosomal protein L24|nr:50S ribosomal protein L24 [Propionibacteriaceae bacterium]